MTMTIDHNQQRFGPLHFEHMSSYSGHPNFTNPWAASSSAGGPGPGPQSGSQQSLYINNQDSAGLPHLNLGALPKHPQHSSRTGSSASMASYGPLPVTAASAGSPPMAGVYRQQDLLPMPQDLLGVNRLQHPTTSAAYDASAYTSAASPVNPTYAASPSPYDQLGYAQGPMRGPFALGHEDSSRRYSQQSVAPSPAFSWTPSAARFDGQRAGPPPKEVITLTVIAGACSRTTGGASRTRWRRARGCSP